MNRFIIVDGLPFLYADGVAFAVRWDKEGFTVGDAVESHGIPCRLLSENEVKAKCINLDSIGADKKQEIIEPDFDGMTLAELKEYAKENEIDLNGARTKAAIIKEIEAAGGES